MRHRYLLAAALLAAPACAPDSAQTASQNDAIVGGAPETIGNVPWQLSLQDVEFGHACGGVILSDRYVLTARHCFNINEEDPDSVLSPHFYRVAAGISKLSRSDQEGQRRAVIDFIPLNHDWDGRKEQLGGDIGLALLAEPLHFDRNVQPIAIATPADERAGCFGPGVLATVSGWGTVGRDANGELSDQLFTLDVPVVPLELAERADPKGIDYAPELIAAGGVDGKDACTGDSGGPLVVRNGGRSLLAGVVSFGIDDNFCGVPGVPGIYTGVAKYADLIKRYLRIRPTIVKRKEQLMGEAKSLQIVEVRVPAGQREVNFNLFGGKGDATLLVSRGKKPTLEDADCLSAVAMSNNESCNFASPQAGSYFVGVFGESDYSDAMLQVNAYKP